MKRVIRRIISLLFIFIQISYSSNLKAESGKVTDRVYKPETVSMDSDILAEGIPRIMNEVIANKDLPGANILIARHGKIVYFESFGKADEGKPFTKDAIFRLASMTKPISAVALLQMVDAGKVRLNEPLSTFWPAYKNARVARFDEEGNMTLEKLEREPTVHDLLTHTAGIMPMDLELYIPHVQKLVTDAGLPVFGENYDIPFLELMETFSRLPLLTQPGERWYYSNWGAAMCLGIVEIVSGMTGDEYIQQHLLQPLNMENTWFYPPKSELTRVTNLYYGLDEGDSKKGDIFKRPPVPAKEDNKRQFYGAGGLHSTSYDYFLFGQMLLNGGQLNGVRVLSKEMARTMTTNQMGDLRDNWFALGGGYQVGVQMEDHPDPEIGIYIGGKGAFCWTGYWSTYFLVNPKYDTVIIILSNAYHTWAGFPTAERIAYLVNRAIK